MLSIPAMFKVASEKTTTATAIPFWAFKDMNISSFNVKFMPLNEKIIAKNLMARYRINNTTDFIKNSRENGITTIIPIRTKTRISREFENTEENSCSWNLCFT